MLPLRRLRFEPLKERALLSVEMQFQHALCHPAENMSGFSSDDRAAELEQETVQVLDGLLSQCDCHKRPPDMRKRMRGDT
jgi:hypothetical protein